jgi:hypothetical protein
MGVHREPGQKGFSWSNIAVGEHRLGRVLSQNFSLTMMQALL